MPLAQQLKCYEGGLGIGGQQKPSESPQGAGGTLAPRVAVTDSGFVVLSLSGFLSSLETPLPQRQSFGVVSRGAPRGPPVG